MAVLLIDAFSIILNWNSFDCGIHWKYFCLWNFLAVLWIVIFPCNTFIVVLSDSISDMSVIFSCSPFVFYTPWKYYCLQHSTTILLMWYSLVVFVSTAIISFVNWNAPLQSFLSL